MKDNKNIEEFYLTNNNLKDEGVMLFADVLKENKKLRETNIRQSAFLIR